MIYPSEFSKSRKRKRIAMIILAISQLTIVIFVVISFLGSAVGRYTVSLEANRAALTIAVDNSFTKETSLLRAQNLEAARAESVDYLPNHDILDSALGQGSHNGDVLDPDGALLYSTYFAYTFYMKNLGDSHVDYQVTMSLAQNKNIVDGAMPIEEYVRVRFYENIDTGGEVTHNFRTFAKTTNNLIYDEDSNRINGECVGNSLKVSPYTCSASNPENNFRAEEFTAVSEILKYNYLDFLPEQIIRYTIVIWLEGDDPECTSLPPAGASMEFGMNIAALIEE